MDDDDFRQIARKEYKMKKKGTKIIALLTASFLIGAAACSSPVQSPEELNISKPSCQMYLKETASEKGSMVDASYFHPGNLEGRTLLFIQQLFSDTELCIEIPLGFDEKTQSWYCGELSGKLTAIRRSATDQQVLKNDENLEYAVWALIDHESPVLQVAVSPARLSPDSPIRKGDSNRLESVLCTKVCDFDLSGLLNNEVRMISQSVESARFSYPFNLYATDGTRLESSERSVSYWTSVGIELTNFPLAE